MEERKDLDTKSIGLMILLTAAWGLQQVILKVTAPDMAPIFQIALRSGIAAIIIGFMVISKGTRRALIPVIGAGLLAGLFFALEFLLVGEGLKHTDASRISIYLYIAPVITAIGLHVVLPTERLNRLQWLGVALAFGGIVTAFVGHDTTSRPGSWIGDLMGIGAGFAFAATTLTIRFSRLSSAPSTVTLFYQLVVAAVLLAGYATSSHQLGFTPSFRLLGSLAFQTLIVSTITFLVWFSLLKSYLASRLSILTFLSPVFGVAFAVLFLGEPLGPSFVTGAAMVLAGIVLVSRKPRIPQMHSARENATACDSSLVPAVAKRCNAE